MTDKQFDVLMNSIIQIVKDSETKEEAVEKLQNLIKGKDNWFCSINRLNLILSSIWVNRYISIFRDIIIGSFFIGNRFNFKLERLPFLFYKKIERNDWYVFYWHAGASNVWAWNEEKA